MTSQPICTQRFAIVLKLWHGLCSAVATNNMIKTKLLHLTLATASILFAQNDICADSITYTFEGVVTEFADAANAFTGVSVNSTLNATLQFDLATADSAPESYYSSYLNGIATLSVALGSYTLNKPNAAWSNVLNIEDNHPVYNRDYFGVAYVIDSSPQYPELIFNLNLSATPPKNPFPTALPPSVIDLSQFDTATIWLRDSFLASGSPLDVKATITSATVSSSVPDGGSTFTLLGLGCVAIAFASGRRFALR
jgi:hypothetical protein